MLSMLRRGKTILLVTFVAGIAVGIAASPVWRFGIVLLFSERFGKLTYRCDSAMREHMLAKQTLSRVPAEENVGLLKQAELGLLDCQDYDIMRKKLIMAGLSENDLSYMSLLAIEERARSLQQVVETHEIRY